jgi:cytochrome P450
MNEELRLIPPVVILPKSTPAGAPQQLVIEGKTVTVPANSTVGLNTIGVHRNPKYWPHGKVRKDGPINPWSHPEYDLDEFKPERWFQKTSGEATSNQAFGDSADADTHVDSTPDTAEALFRPVKGAYIPFSDGARSCLGRRFAQVEILATLAVIFSKYSVELCVDQFATEDEILKMDNKQRRQVWKRARAEVEHRLEHEMETIITIQLRGDPVRLRIVDRGNEWFNFEDDE